MREDAATRRVEAPAHTGVHVGSLLVLAVVVALCGLVLLRLGRPRRDPMSAQVLAAPK